MPDALVQRYFALLVAILLLLTGVFVCNANSTRYRFDVWTTDDGLPQNTVNGLVQTPDRYIWFATSDGIVRFDGVRFKVFNRANTPQLPSNRFNNALVDGSGRVWFQTESGYVVSHANGEFSVLKTTSGEPVIAAGAVHRDHNGNLVLVANGQLFTYTGDGLEPRPVESFKPETTVYHADRAGGFWLIDGLRNFRRVLGNDVTYWPQFDRQSLLPTAVYEDRFGRFWSRTPDGFLARIKDKDLTVFDLPISKFARFREDSDGNLLIPGQASFLRIGADDFAAETISPATTETYQLAGISAETIVLSTLRDSEDGLWFGTDRNGLVHITPQEVRVYAKENWGTKDENIYPILETRGGDMILGAWERSLVRMSRGGDFSLLATRNDMTLPSLLHEDRRGCLWYGNRGLFRRCPQDAAFVAVELPPLPAESSFSAVYEDSLGSLWFGSEAGLFRLRDDRIEWFQQINGTRLRGITTIISVIDSPDFWVGTTAGVLRIGYDEPGGPPQLRSQITYADGLVGDYVRSLYHEPDGTLWIGSYDNGLTRFRNGRLTNFQITHGMFSNNVFCIVEDERGWFWMNSNQGIYRVHKDNLNDVADGRAAYLTSVAYTKKDGLLSSEGNGGKQPSAQLRDNGEIWFPTQRGVAVIDTRRVTTNQLAPAVRIEEVLIDRREVTTTSGQVTIQPDQNSLQINFTGISFINSPLVKFRYRLIGADEKWIEAGTQRAAFYNYLPSGEYEFQVLAANRDGVWNDTAATLRIYVRPHFYQTWWFLVACAFALVAVVSLAYAARVRQLKRISAARSAFASQLIESQEAERKRIAAELHDGLGQTLAMIHNRAILGQEEAKTPEATDETFQAITDQTSHAINEVREIAYNLRPYLLDRLGLTRALRSLAAKTAAAHRMNLVETIDDIDGVLRPSDEMSVYRIVQETLGNVLKHARASELSVRIIRRDGGLAITIRDNGRGFDLADENRTEPGRGGFGLLNLRERVRLLGGTVQIQSEPGKGTTVDILLYSGNSSTRE